MERFAGLPLRIRSLRIAFREPRAQWRVVLDVPEFDLPGTAQLALCGPSGSGKTSLLHVLAAIERPAQGAVCWGAVETSSLPPAVADRWRGDTVGIVFQRFHLFPGLSALENVVVAQRFRRLRVPEDAIDRARALLDRVGVGAARRVETLSRGEMQRVAVARAVLHRPAIVLADEPTASLDREAAGSVADLLCNVCREMNASLVVATHDAALVERFDTRADIDHRRLLVAETDAVAGGHG